VKGDVVAAMEEGAAAAMFLSRASYPSQTGQ